jgi:hypothetical protein
MSDTDNRIKEYEAKFHDLSLAFQGRSIIRTEITVLRILDHIDNISA